jgi:protein O-GlcNAc transferase
LSHKPLGREETGARLQHAVALHMQGQIAQAIPVYQAVIDQDSRHSDALQLLGMALTQAGEPARGAELIGRSLEINPAQPVVRTNLGHAQLALRQFAAALESYERALSLSPAYAPAHNGRGSALAELGRPEEGLQAIDQALRLAPGLVEALSNRGAALFKLRRYEAGVAAYGEALALRPGDPQLYVGRALGHLQLWRYAEALADSERALGIHPGIAEAVPPCCAALIGLRRFAEAVAVIDGQPGRGESDPELVFLRANCLRQMGRAPEALAAYHRALALRPRFAEALAALAMLQSAERQLDAAAASYACLLEIAPEGDFNRGMALHARLHVFDWSDYASEAGAIIADLDSGRRSDMPFTFLSVSDDPARQLRCAQAYASACPAAGPALHRAPRGAHERIRVAYVSADLLEHPLAYLAAGLFESHDRARFETIAISLRSDPASPTQHRLRLAFGRFIDVSRATDEEIARLMSELEVDIAVDLMGYTAEERPGILRRRPAPIQVNYLGMPATMGAPHIDYLIADRFVIPPHEAPHYSERIAYLPDCFQVNDSRRVSPEGEFHRSELGLPEQGFVFCAFHASVKITPPLFDVWVRVFQAVPGSVLWLVANTEAAADRLRGEAARRGLDPNRLVFAQRDSYPRHLSRLALADLCLDTFPFNGGATASDALWRGVPMITRSGRSLSSRMSGSLLHTLGLSELVTDNWGDYERLACRLASDRKELNAVRERLAQGRTHGPLFDTDRTRRYIEAAYTIMWERHARGAAPASFEVPRQLMSA